MIRLNAFLMLFLALTSVVVLARPQGSLMGPGTSDSILKNGTYSYKNEIKELEMKEDFKLILRNVTTKSADFQYFANQAACDVEFRGRLWKKNGIYVYKSPNGKNSFSVKKMGSKLVIKTIRCVEDECALCPRDAVYVRSH